MSLLRFPKLQVLLVAGLSISACVTPIPSLHPPTPILQMDRPIAFSLGDWNIYTVNPDGSNLTRLTYNLYTTSAPRWSPDGTHLSFWAFPTRETNLDHLYLIASDGSGLTRLTPDEWAGNSASTDPVWSPDGTQIAFAFYHLWRGLGIYVVNVENSRVTRLVEAEGPLQLVWSPDGKRIAFVSLNSEQNQVNIVNKDGSNLTRLTMDDYFFVMDPTWSPDGKRLAFVCGRGDRVLYSERICIMDINRSNPIEIPYLKGYIGHLAWSPDSKRLIFDCLSFQEGCGGYKGDHDSIYSIRDNGSGLVRLWNEDMSAGSPVWSPDGKRIAFKVWGNGDDNGQIYIMNADGSNKTQLTHNRSYLDHLVWWP